MPSLWSGPGMEKVVEEGEEEEEEEEEHAMPRPPVRPSSGRGLIDLKRSEGRAFTSLRGSKVQSVGGPFSACAKPSNLIPCKT